jgi:hypothetical protein
VVIKLIIMSNIPSGFDLSDPTFIFFNIFLCILIIWQLYRTFFSKEMLEKLSFNEEMEKLYKRWPLDYYSEQKSEWICNYCSIKNDLSYNICFSCSNEKGENERIVKEDWQQAYYRILNESSFTQGNGYGVDGAVEFPHLDPAEGLDRYLNRHNNDFLSRQKIEFGICILAYLVYLFFCIYFTYFSEFKHLMNLIIK